MDYFLGNYMSNRISAFHKLFVHLFADLVLSSRAHLILIFHLLWPAYWKNGPHDAGAEKIVIFIFPSYSSIFLGRNYNLHMRATFEKLLIKFHDFSNLVHMPSFLPYNNWMGFFCQIIVEKGVYWWFRICTVFFIFVNYIFIRKVDKVWK